MTITRRALETAKTAQALLVSARRFAEKLPAAERLAALKQIIEASKPVGKVINDVAAALDIVDPFERHDAGCAAMNNAAHALAAAEALEVLIASQHANNLRLAKLGA